MVLVYVQPVGGFLGGQVVKGVGGLYKDVINVLILVIVILMAMAVGWVMVVGVSYMV